MVRFTYLLSIPRYLTTLYQLWISFVVECDERMLMLDELEDVDLCGL